MVGTNPYHVVALPRRPAVSPCCLLPVPSAVCACVLLCRARVLLRQQCVGAAALALRSCVRACCVGRVRSVRPCVRAAASAAHGPFRGFRAFIPRWWETMVGSNPYHVARSVRSAASVAHGRFHRFRTFIPRRWETMVGTNSHHVVAPRRRSVRPPRSPKARFIVFGRLYPGGGKQWSAPIPTMLWRCPVGPVGRLGPPRSVSSISDVYTQEVGNNGRDQPQPCCGVATSARLVHGLIALGAAYSVARCCDVRACVLLRLPCVQLRLPCVRAAASAVRACCCVGRA